MALVTTYTCSRCNTERYELVTPNHVCSYCRADDAAAASRARRTFLMGLTALDKHERLARLEDMTYCIADLVKRVEALEAHNVRY